MFLKKPIKSLASFLFHHQLCKLHEFKGIHSGEKCYIFGDGITTKWFDFDLFSDRPSFVMNYMPFNNNFDKLDARYISFIEPWTFYGKYKSKFTNNKYVFNDIQQAYKNNVIQKYKDRNFFVSLSNLFAVNGDNIYYTFENFRDARLPSSFIDRTHNYNKGSFRWSLCLAIYMGFTDIELVGCDYTAEISRSHHWYEYGQGVLRGQPNYERPFLEAALQYANIKTITLEGKGSVLPAITYEKKFGVMPIYNENTELLSKNYFDILKKWKNYKIEAS